MILKSALGKQHETAIIWQRGVLRNRIQWQRDQVHVANAGHNIMYVRYEVLIAVTMNNRDYYLLGRYAAQFGINDAEEPLLSASRELFHRRQCSSHSYT
jgi:hypothetical protein